MSCIPKNSSKRPFMLLEVMVAFTLVLLCVVPLLRTHLMMFHEERRLVKEMEAQQLAGVIFSEVIPLLYENQIPWEVIEGSGDLLSYVDESPLNTVIVQAKKLGYIPQVSFDSVLSKPKGSEEGCFIKTMVVTLTNEKAKPKRRQVLHKRDIVIERKVLEVTP